MLASDPLATGSAMALRGSLPVRALVVSEYPFVFSAGRAERTLRYGSPTRE